MAGEKSRPILVTLIAILYLLTGIAMFATGITALVGGVAVEEIEMGAVGGAVGLVMGLVFIILFLGFWKGWSIFWYLGMLVTVISAIMGLVAVIGGALPMLVTLVIDLIIIWYLRSDKVKSFFLD